MTNCIMTYAHICIVEGEFSVLSSSAFNLRRKPNRRRVITYIKNDRHLLLEKNDRARLIVNRISSQFPSNDKKA